MENSSWLIFSFIENVKKGLKKRDQNIDLYNLINSRWYYALTPNTKTQLARIYSDMENGHYTFTDIIFFILVEKIYDNKVTVFNLYKKNILECKKQFKKRIVAEDLKRLERIKQKELLSVEDLFKIVDNTTPLYSLLMNKKISPATYIYYYKKYYLTSNVACCSLDSKYKEVHFIIDWLFNIFTKGI